MAERCENYGYQYMAGPGTFMGSVLFAELVYLGLFMAGFLVLFLVFQLPLTVSLLWLLVVAALAALFYRNLKRRYVGYLYATRSGRDRYAGGPEYQAGP